MFDFLSLLAPFLVLPNMYFPTTTNCRRQDRLLLIGCGCGCGGYCCRWWWWSIRGPLINKTDPEMGFNWTKNGEWREFGRATNLGTRCTRQVSQSQSLSHSDPHAMATEDDYMLNWDERRRRQTTRTLVRMLLNIPSMTERWLMSCSCQVVNYYHFIGMSWAFILFSCTGINRHGQITVLFECLLLLISDDMVSLIFSRFHSMLNQRVNLKMGYLILLILI